MKKKLLTILLILAAVLCLTLGLVACGGFGGDGGSGENVEKGEDGHVHMADYFEVNDEEHWKICTICGEKFSVGKHSYRSDNACKYCGYNLVYTKGLSYELNEETDTYKVTGIGDAKDESEIIIPAYYEGKAVTSIGDSVFNRIRDTTAKSKILSKQPLSRA